MSNRNNDILFQLIHSLSKAEKRNFKLYSKRNSANSDLKIIELFDAMDKLSDYDEAILFKKLVTIKKPQLANVKAHLYKQLLASLRLIKTNVSIELELHEQLDYAKILYNKGLYLQSLKLLERVKELSKAQHQYSYLIQAISLEKKIETLHITRSLEHRADSLCQEAEEVQMKRELITRLSNLALKMYSFYIKNGHARNPEEEQGFTNYFNSHLTPEALNNKGFYEQLYVFQSYVWYSFICQNFLMYYRYSAKWVQLFDANPLMKEIETGHYLKGMHNLLNAHFDLRNYKKFDETLSYFENFSKTDLASQNNNNLIQTFIYISSAKLNRFIMFGNFEDGLKIIPSLEIQISLYRHFLDRHRVLVFNYKAASLYFGAGDYNTCIDYLRRIINEPTDLRTDLQCYARLLHLIAHYEIGNYELMETLSRSVYRFMAKMKNLTRIEEEMFKFLKATFYVKPAAMQPEFLSLLQRIKKYEKDRFETRSFAYLDVVSWVESKVNNTTLAKIIQQKYQNSPHK